MATVLKRANEQSATAWRGFAPGTWQSRVNVREFIQRNYMPYEGDGKFLQGATERTRGLWQKLQPLLAQERDKGILDVSQVPSAILAHAPGYIDKDHEIIVGLQTDAPLKRAIMPFGGWRVVAASLEGVRLQAGRSRSARSSPNIARRTTTACSTPTRPTSAPAALVGHHHRPAGRLRPRPHHRRLSPRRALRRRLPDRRQAAREARARRSRMSTEDMIRLREELAEQIRALKELKEMAARYGYDISGPATNAREAVQWTYFGYLAAIKEQNGAAMSLGPHVDLPRHLLRARPARGHADRGAGAGDHRRLRDQAADRALPAHARIQRSCSRATRPGSPSASAAWARTAARWSPRRSFRMLHTLYNLGPAPEPNLTVFWSPRLPDGFKRFCDQGLDRHQRRSSTRTTT